MVPIEEVEVPTEGKFRLYHLQLDAKDCKVLHNALMDILHNFTHDITVSLFQEQRGRKVDYVDIGVPERNHRTFIQYFDGGGYLSLLVFEDIKEIYMDLVLPLPFDSDIVKEIFDNTFKPFVVSLSQHARQA